ncbi:MAG: hypothetical protein JWO31_13 [Phycisphaerales bacterium]|nr:hypothetical protein [Phycisphaerales bacterium]
MDATSLILSLLFGMVGTGFVMYAKNAAKLVPAVAGIGLMVIPFFISDVVVMAIVCVAITCVPFVYRDL